MTYFQKEIDVINLAPGRRKEIHNAISKPEEGRVWAVAGKLAYLSVCVSPTAAFAAIYIRKLIPGMKVAGMKHVNGIVREVLSRTPKITYLQASKAAQREARVAVFSDS